MEESVKNRQIELDTIRKFIAYEKLNFTRRSDICRKITKGFNISPDLCEELMTIRDGSIDRLVVCILNRVRKNQTRDDIFEFYKSTPDSHSIVE